MSAAPRFPLDLGQGLVLHATTSRDADEAFAIIDAERARLGEWLPWERHTVDVAAERSFLQSQEVSNAAGTGLHATLRYRGRLAGFAGIRINEPSASAEAGYWLGAA